MVEMGLFYFVVITCLIFQHCSCGIANNYQLIRGCRYAGNNKKAICSNLHYIPKINNVISLELKNNSLPHIRRDSFQNVSGMQLNTLIFNHNLVKTIAPDAFLDLRFLQKLEIKYEELISMADLKASFQSLNIKTFVSIGIEHTNLTTLPLDFFEYLNQSDFLSDISLSHNKLSEIDFRLFRHLTKFRKISCTGNKITNIVAENLPTLNKLDLSDNNIYETPTFCNETSHTSFVTNLTYLNLSYNAIRDLSSTSFKCLDNLKTLILDGNRIKSLENNVFATLKALHMLSLCYIPQLIVIKDRAFNSSSLQELRFYHNSFRFDRSQHYQPTKIFHFLPKLTELDLTNNYLPKNDTKTLNMFSSLSNLKKLILHSTDISSFPEGILRKMPYLEILNLQGNKISRWDVALFENVTSLQKLILSGNHIHVINETSFPQSLLDSIKEIDLSSNQFWCTCEQRWFLDIIRTNLTKKMLAWPKRYTCYYPEELRFSMLIRYKPTDDECSPFKVLSLVIIITSSTGMIMFILIIFVVKCSTNIRNCIYFLRVYQRLKKGYFRLETPEDYEFDVFIVYCDADREWVHNTLLRKLEGSGLHVCVHHRDFDVGEQITNNIQNYMDKSWKVVVVMSNQFTKNEWCQWEVELVQERRRRHGKEALVLIMYHQIDSRHMTGTLRALLDTTPHLTYVTGFGEHLFWTSVLRDVKKSLSFPPTAVL